MLNVRRESLVTLPRGYGSRRKCTIVQRNDAGECVYRTVFLNPHVKSKVGTKFHPKWRWRLW